MSDSSDRLPVRVVPAILTDSLAALARMVTVANGFAPYVQIDIMDGIFVPSRSIEAADLHAQTIAFKWEAHLMVENPLPYLEPFRNAGASRLIIHAEAVDDPLAVVARIRELGLEAGVAINPPTPVGAIEHLVAEVDSVLLMTVYPGFYGAPFVPEVMSKVPQVRALSSEVEIAVDGGIKEGNIAHVARQGIDTVCVGSAVFANDDPGASFRRLEALVRGR
jgi:ribulose-phosphate 3-epimerase